MIKYSGTIERWGTMDAWNDHEAWIRRPEWAMLQDQSDEDRRHHNKNQVAHGNHPNIHGGLHQK